MQKQWVTSLLLSSPRVAPLSAPVLQQSPVEPSCFCFFLCGWFLILNLTFIRYASFQNFHVFWVNFGDSCLLRNLSISLCLPFIFLLRIS